MYQPPVAASSTTTTTLDTEAPVDATPDQRGLRAMRIAFIALTVTIILLDALAEPYAFASLSTPAILRELHRIHLSPVLFDAIEIVQTLGYMLIYLAMALLLFWRGANDRMAMFCAIMLVLFGCATTGGFLFDISTGSTVPLLGNNLVIHELILLLFASGEFCFLLFFFIFPSGRFAPRWTRWAAVAAGIYWLATVFDPTIPVGPAGVLVIVFIAAAAIAQVYRYRRISSPVEREQTKWVVFGIFVCALIIVAPQVAFAVIPRTTIGPFLDNSPLIGQLVFGAPWEIGLALVPIFIAVAVLRSHLWDIDTLINRTLVYGVLTALLAAIYAGLTIGLERLSGAVTGSASQQPAVIVVSTLVIAALFQPLRGRIQQVIDQRFYRRKYDTARTLTTFSATLRQEVDLEDLRARLLVVVAETMQPTHLSLWLRHPAPPAHPPTASRERF